MIEPRQSWLDAIGIPVWQARSPSSLPSLELHWLQRGSAHGLLWILDDWSLPLFYRDDRASPLLLSLWQALGLVAQEQYLVCLQPAANNDLWLAELSACSARTQVVLGQDAVHWLHAHLPCICPDIADLRQNWRVRQRLCWQLWSLGQPNELRT